MIRLFSFVGSCAGESSATAKLSDELAEAFREVAEAAGETVSYERMTGADLRIDYCRSCTECFRHGVCPLDSMDDMPKLKAKLLECDVLLFGSPVYLWEMSGIAKSVIDRITYWTHRFELLGKPCAVFSTTDTSHGAEVAEQLRLLMSFTGAITVNAGYRTKKEQAEIYREKNAQKMREAAQRLLEAYRDPCSGITHFQQRVFFSRVYMNRRILLHAEENGAEIWDETRVCEARGINRYVLMSEAIEGLCGKGRKNGAEQENSAE